MFLGVSRWPCFRRPPFRWPLPNRSKQHYKVLAVLERAPGSPNGHRPAGGDTSPAPRWWQIFRRRKDTDERRKVFADPEVVGGIKGGLRRGTIQKTRSRTRPSRLVFVLIWALVLISLAEPAVLSRSLGRAVPLDCAMGRLTLTGSTAFEPVLREAAGMYGDTCPEAHFAYDFNGSGNGLITLDHAEAGVGDLSQQQIRAIFNGEYGNWAQVNGNNIPIRLVRRNPGSGTRTTFLKGVLDQSEEPGDNSDDCRTDGASGTSNRAVRCNRNSTADVLDAVAENPGAIGYGELRAATDRRNQKQDLDLVRINDQPAALDGAVHAAYPFWETEYAYTRGEPPAGSLAASFLRFLTNEVGQDIVRAHGDRPCAELQNPVLCSPSGQEPPPSTG